MIVIDTNVISELWNAEPNPLVVRWMDNQAIETLYLSAITLAELRFGLAILPAGKRRDVLQNRLDQKVLPLFDGRILPFGLPETQAYAALMARARAAGQAISPADGHIAATAATHGLMVATRDTRPFEAAGLKALDPWHHTG